MINRTLYEAKEGFVQLDIEGEIGIITFFHPAHNSLPNDLLKILTATIRAVGENEFIAIVLLQSGGEKTFCAGASFDELAKIQDFEAGKAFFMQFGHLMNAIRECPKIVIGKVQGKAIGGGVGIAAVCDYCFATEEAAIRLSELTIGIGPFVIQPAVERKIGLANFSQLCLEPTNWKPAAWAKEKGLFANVLSDRASMEEAALTMARQFCTYHPAALKELKQMLWHDTAHWGSLFEELAAINGRLVLSAFTKSAIANIKSKA